MTKICSGFFSRSNHNYQAVSRTAPEFKRHYVRVSNHSNQVVIANDQTHVKVNALVKYSLEDAEHSDRHIKDLNHYTKLTLQERLSQFSSHEIVYHRTLLGQEVLKGLQMAAVFWGIKLDSLHIEASIESSNALSEKPAGQRILEEKLRRFG
ncbi:MAG TPA: hypothetical protein VLG49_08490 [Rhabdochlamydiaceae bacterium]|nr:hypothetical protein [Rhabdochlamydiaceae bacterium]